MLRLSLFLSGLLSFIYFLTPGKFAWVNSSGEKVLGIKNMNQAANRESVYTAILAYCLDKGKPPLDLNDLYKAELKSEQRLDLNSLYHLKSGEGCEFSLEPLTPS